MEKTAKNFFSKKMDETTTNSPQKELQNANIAIGT